MIRVIKFLYRLYLNLWLRWRGKRFAPLGGYRPVTAGEYVRDLERKS